MESSMRKVFECSVCSEFSFPPIQQCMNGHIVCVDCRKAFSICPVCRTGPCNVRNLAMDKFAATLSFPCKFAANGCKEYLDIASKSKHENLCQLRPYKCPCPGTSCEWVGKLEQVIDHLSEEHKNITTLQGEDIVFLATDINLSGAVDWVMMQNCFGFNFILVLEKHISGGNDYLYYAIVQMVGTVKQADMFVYRLQLSHGSRKLTWEASPRSIHDGLLATIKDSDCLIFDARTAQYFSDCGGNLCINVNIAKTPSTKQLQPHDAQTAASVHGSTAASQHHQPEHSDQMPPLLLDQHSDSHHHSSVTATHNDANQNRNGRLKPVYTGLLKSTSNSGATASNAHEHASLGGGGDDGHSNSSSIASSPGDTCFTEAHNTSVITVNAKCH